MSRLLDGAHEECLHTLRDAVFASFMRKPIPQKQDSSPTDKYRVLHQVYHWRTCCFLDTIGLITIHSAAPRTFHKCIQW